MKKLLISVLFIGALMTTAFAETESDKIFGITPGIRLSILGLEPTVAVDITHLELEGACAFSTGFDGKQFGIAPSFSAAYITNPFEKGGSAAFGLEYMYLTPSYTNMIVKFIDKDNDEDVLPGIHSVSFFYKGCYNFNSVIGLLWRLRLPLMIAGKKDDVSFNMNITNLPGFAGCFLIGVCTTSIGVKFTF